jgi:hypothetical protein
MVITGIKFLALEFDFGYSEETEEDRQNLGRIDAEVFVDVDDNGDTSTLTHKVRLDEVSFLDFMDEQDVDDLDFGNSFSSAIQQIRQLVAMKVASDLNIQLAGVGYVPSTPLRDAVNALEISQADQDDVIMDIILGRV